VYGGAVYGGAVYGGAVYGGAKYLCVSMNFFHVSDGQNFEVAFCVL
jgi:hypothetical protein